MGTFSSLTSGAGRFSADLETTELGSCQSSGDTQRAVSPQRDSCANLIFECQWLESRGSQRSSQMRLFCKIYLDCHSQWCALLRRWAALGLWLSSTQFRFLALWIWAKEQETCDERWQKLWTTSPVNALFRAQNFSKTKIRKVSYLKHLIHARIQ